MTCMLFSLWLTSTSTLCLSSVIPPLTKKKNLRYLASSVFIFLQNGGCINSASTSTHPASGSTLKTIRPAGTLSVTATCFTVTSYDIQESFRGCGFVCRNRNVLPVFLTPPPLCRLHFISFSDPLLNREIDSEGVIHSCCWCWRKNFWFYTCSATTNLLLEALQVE